eukprot:EG_transcript_7584
MRSCLSIDTEGSSPRSFAESERVLASAQCLHEELEAYAEELRARAQSSAVELVYLQQLLEEKEVAIRDLRDSQKAAQCFARAQEQQLHQSARQAQRLQRQIQQLKGGIQIMQQQRQRDQLERLAERAAAAIALEEREAAIELERCQHQALFWQLVQQLAGERVKGIVVPLLHIEPPVPDLWLGTEWVVVDRFEAATSGCGGSDTGAETVLLGLHGADPGRGRASMAGSEDCGLTPDCPTPLEGTPADDSFPQRLLRGLQSLTPRGLLTPRQS